MNDDLQSELLSAYLDGALSAEERAQVEHLLATQPGARKRLDELRSVSAALKSLPRQKLDEDLSESVLRIAQRRMLNEAAEKREPEKIGAGAEPEPEVLAAPAPVYSTVLRRLKNPRMWMWEIVIAAVAVLLMVYYPGSNPNGQPAGKAERNIAMAAKPEEKQNSSAPGGTRAAPATAAPEPKGSLDALIINGKQPDTSALSGVAPADKTRKSLAQTPATRKAGEAAGKADESGRLEGDETPAKGKFAAAPEDAARDTADSGKKEGPASDQKLATKDTSAAPFTAGPKGTVAESETTVPTSTPTSGLAVQRQSKPARPPAATTAEESAVSKIEPAGPPVQEQSTEPEKSPAAPAGELLVVRCQIAPEALGNHAFDKILADNAIVWSDAPKESPAAGNQPEFDAIRSLSTAKTDRAENKPGGAIGGMGGGKDAGAGQLGSSMTGPVEMVYVEASPAQIEATLKGLSAQAEMFKSVSIAPAKADSRLRTAVDGVNSRGEISRAGDEARAYGGQGGESADRFRSQARSDSSAPASAAMGRARRIPFSYVNNAKQAGAENGVRQKLADDAKNRMPGATDFGAVAPGPSGKAQSAGQLGFGSVAPPSATPGGAGMERVLFVFQVMERKDKREDADKKAPAEAAGVGAPAADANSPSKP